MKRIWGLLSLAWLLPQGCLNLGAERIRPEPVRFQVQACAKDQPLERKSQETAWALRFIGPATPLATAKAPWGATLRYVLPYTRHTELYELKVTNLGKQVMWVDPAAISLQGDGKALAPLGLAFFERAWPGAAVTSDAELIDRSLAMSEVIQTLFVRRPLEPGESYTGILPFLTQTTPPTQLSIKGFQRGKTRLATDFCLSWSPSAQP